MPHTNDNVTFLIFEYNIFKKFIGYPVFPMYVFDYHKLENNLPVALGDKCHDNRNKENIFS